jgi:hypothetical protein
MKDTPPQKLPPHNLLGIIGILLICSKTKTKNTSVTSVKKYISTNAGRHIIRMTSILLFSRKIYSCFHWDCIVDAKRVDVLLEMFLEKKLPSAQKW